MREFTLIYRVSTKLFLLAEVLSKISTASKNFTKFEIIPNFALKNSLTVWNFPHILSNYWEKKIRVLLNFGNFSIICSIQINNLIWLSLRSVSTSEHFSVFSKLLNKYLPLIKSISIFFTSSKTIVKSENKLSKYEDEFRFEQFSIKFLLKWLTLIRHRLICWRN